MHFVDDLEQGVVASCVPLEKLLDKGSKDWIGSDRPLSIGFHIEVTQRSYRRVNPLFGLLDHAFLGGLPANAYPDS